MLHGSYGEDGTIQGLLDMLDVPYVGVGVLGAAVCMDKDVCKRLLRDAGIAVVPFEVVTARAAGAPSPSGAPPPPRALGSPLFVKPANLGSSLGVTQVREDAAATLDAAIETALALDAKVLIERGIDGREIECAVLGNDDPQASIPGEIVPGEAFYSYDDKYAADSQARLLHPGAARRRDCASACATWPCAPSARSSARGMARVDFFLEHGDRRALRQRAQHHPRVHLDQHVPEAVGGDRAQRYGAGHAPDRARARAPCDARRRGRLAPGGRARRPRPRRAHMCSPMRL